MTQPYYKFTNHHKIAQDGFLVTRIQAIKDIENTNIKKGFLGGYISSYKNLKDNAWVAGHAIVSGNAIVSGYAIVFEYAKVSGNAIVSENAKVAGDAKVYGDAQVAGYSKVFGNKIVYRNTKETK